MSLQINSPEYYRTLNYRIEIERDEEGDFVATIPLLPGCIADAATVEEAAAQILVAKEEWIAARIEAGLPIPEPQTEYSGRWLIRTSPSLHRKVAVCAEAEKISINQFVNNVLAETVGYCRSNAGVFAIQPPKLFNFGGQERYHVLAFGNQVRGGFFWQCSVGQNEPIGKTLDVNEPVAELRA